MYSSVSISNFMRLSGPVEIPLGRVTILVGANGSGKSSALKAIHWAVRCASLRIGDKTTLEQMDYVPSRDFLELAHKRRLQNPEGAPKVTVSFKSAEFVERSISISAARNDAGVKTKLAGSIDELLDAESPKTAYIPGLAGLAETETVLASPVLRRKAASGDGGSVLRHILLDLADPSGNCPDPVELAELNNWVAQVIPNARFWVKFDRQRDVIIRSEFSTRDLSTEKPQRKPLEMAGTGFLQVVQIFAYLLRYKPKLVLIDEPDAHLHPGTQEALIRTIEKAANSFPETQFIITSHSPTFVRASSQETRIVWMDDGAVRDTDSPKVRKKMGWSLLDKKLMLITEDSNLQHLKAIIAQWPDIERNVLVSPTFGKDNIPNGQKVKKIRSELGIDVIVHRDRDFMDEAQILAWAKSKEFDIHAVQYWITPGSDIESCFVDNDHIKIVLNLDDAKVAKLFDAAISSFTEDEASKIFQNAFLGATSTLKDVEKNGISRWKELAWPSAKCLKGCDFFDRIKGIAKNQASSPEELARVGRLMTPHPDREIATSLRDLCRALLK